MQFNNFMDIDGIDSHIVCWGNGVDEDHPEEVVICIPGNPGLAEFYFPYLEELHAVSNLPVWIIGHAGHEENEEISEDGSVKKVRENNTLYNLHDQLMHKISFIKKFTKSSTKIHLVGHSIGAWIVMQILKDVDLKPRIKSANLLYPTIQKMAASPNGFWLNKIARKITPLILLIIYIFFLFPMFMKVFFISTYFRIKSLRHSMLTTILKYLRPSVIDNVLYMAYDEMDRVVEIDMENLERNKSIIKIIYTKFDGWAPGMYFDELRSIMPDLYIEEVKYEHAFVINASEPVAALTNKFIGKCV